MDRELIAKLIPLLGSDKPGEVAATVAAIDRNLRSGNEDWHALARIIRKPDDPVKPESAPRPSRPRTSGPPRGPYHWRTAARWCATQDLGADESYFVSWARMARSLTDDQHEELREIFVRLAEEWRGAQ